MIITALYASLLVALIVFLTARVIIYRRQNKISLGDGEDETMRRRIRAHSNCVEYTPLAILMIGIAESLAVSPILLHLIGILFLTGRIIHAYGVGGPAMNMKWRTIGMIMTLNSLVISVLVNFASFFMGPY